jgi:hypothetical protein
MSWRESPRELSREHRPWDSGAAAAPLSEEVQPDLTVLEMAEEILTRQAMVSLATLRCLDISQKFPSTHLGV